jgi:hypothetical protein
MRVGQIGVLSHAVRLNGAQRGQKIFCTSPTKLSTLITRELKEERM